MHRFGNFRSHVPMGKMLFALLSLAVPMSLAGCDAEAPSDDSQDSKPKEEPKGIKPVTPQEESKKEIPKPESKEELPSENKNQGPNEGVDANDCGESKFQAEPLPPNVMLVLDQSGSMSQQKWMDNGVLKTRWSSLHATTKFLLDSFGDQVNFGLKLFPSKQKGGGFDFTKACTVDPGVDVPCKEKSASAILDTLPKAEEQFMGSTPTVGGLREAYTHLSGLSDPNAEAAILIVDGRTNCSQSNIELSATAAEAYSRGILVYVVGIDLDLTTESSLGAVALAGGTEKVYNSTDSKALADSLAKILGGIASCTIPLEKSPPYADLVKVKLGAKSEIPFLKTFTSCEAAASAGTPDGWIYRSEKGPFKELELCGSSCTAFKSTPKVDVAYECPPPV